MLHCQQVTQLQQGCSLTRRIDKFEKIDHITCAEEWALCVTCHQKHKNQHFSVLTRERKRTNITLGRLWYLQHRMTTFRIIFWYSKLFYIVVQSSKMFTTSQV
jgi:hypothetical protein